MKKKIRLTETELTNLIKQVVIESNTKKRRVSEGPENFFNPEALDTAEAIYTIIGTTVGMLGIAGYDVLKGYAKELMKAGKKKEAKEMMSAIKDMQSKGEQGGEIGEEESRKKGCCRKGYGCTNKDYKCINCKCTYAPTPYD
jgi:hypothetical protein